MSASRHGAPRLRSRRSFRLGIESLEDRTVPSSGFPVLPNLQSITPMISVSRTSGQVPFAIQIDGNATRAVGSDHPFDQLDYTWSFGSPAGQRTLVNPTTHQTVDASTGQTGPEASFIYDNPGSYTITLTVRGWTGSTYVTASTTKIVNALPWSGQDMYFDASAGNDANPGTQAAPKQTWAAVASFLTSNNNSNGSSNRRALLMDGTTFKTSTGLRLRYNDSNLVVASYGNGPAPVVQATASMTSLLSVETDFGRSINDVRVQGISFDGNGLASNDILGYRARNNIASGLPYGSSSYIYFIDSSFSGSTSTTVNVSMTTTADGGAANNWGFWNDQVASGNSPGQGLYFGLDAYGFVVGGSYSGGNGSLKYDHHIYLNVWGQAIVRWVDFQAATSRNFAINANCRTDGVTVNYILIDGCNVTGTQNGIDFGNSSNVPSQGQFDNVIVENTSVHNVGTAGTQSVGVFGETLRRITIRDSSFYANGILPNGVPFYTISTDYMSTDPSTYALIYRDKFWKSSTVRSSSLMIGGTAGGYVCYNIFETLASPTSSMQAAIRYDSTHLAGWIVDANQYYTPNLIVGGVPVPFADTARTTRLSLSGWQALGFDLNGIYQDPRWVDPANGIF